MNTHGSIYAIKYKKSDGTEKYLEPTEAPIAEDLLKIAKFINQNNRTSAEVTIKNLADKTSLRGQLIFVERKIERIEFYKTGKWISENEIATFNVE